MKSSSRAQERFGEPVDPSDAIHLFASRGKCGFYHVDGQVFEKDSRALRWRSCHSDLRLQYPESIDGHETYVLRGSQAGQPSAKLYFDQESALLMRVIRYAESPLGLDPSQVDYADYREVDGVEVPFRITVSEPGKSSTFRVEQVQQNVAIDDARFTKPEHR